MSTKMQLVAICILGAAIALALLLGGYYIPGFVVMGGAFALGLRIGRRSGNADRPKPPTPQAPPRSTSSGPSNTGLRDVTPDVFAALIVERMFANQPPFDGWRPDAGVIPENAVAVCELYSRAY